MRASRAIGIAVLALPALLTLPAGAAAQGPVARDCEYSLVRQLSWQDLGARARSLYPDSAFVRMATRMAENQWVFLADSIAAEMESDPGIAAGEKLIFLRQLEALQSELRAVAASGDPTGFRNRGEGVAQARFRIAPVPSEAEVYELFLDGPTTLVVAESLDSASRRSICWRAMTLSRMLSAYGGPGRKIAVAALEASEKRWDNYTTKGYSQFPWELLLNSSRFSATSQDPPRSQLVFLHPAIALELIAPSFDSLEHLRRQDAISVEPFGYLRYNRARSVYYGVSTLVSLPSDGLVGAGLLGHIGTYGKIGVILWRAKDDAGSENRSVIVSADFYQLLTDVPAKLRDAKSKALQAVARQELLPATEPR